MGGAENGLAKEIGTKHPSRGTFSPSAEKGWAEAAWPLGAFLAPDGACEFAVYSGPAEAMLLEIYGTALESDAAYDYRMARGADGIWRARVAGLPPGTLYGIRAWGPNWRPHPEWRRGNSKAGFVSDCDSAGNRFNPNKLLLDPYAREFSHDRSGPAIRALGDDGGIYGTGGRDTSFDHAYLGALAGLAPVDRRDVDTGPRAPKSVLVSDTSPTGARPHLPPHEASIYEAHLRGLTMHPSAGRLKASLRGLPGFERVGDVPERLRGTYAGAALMAPYIKALGYTAIEFLPVQETLNDDNPEDRPGGNFWGYMTYGFFAPDRRYAADKSPGGPTREFKAMVAAFHAEGVEVYLDVVYNHTGEGGVWDSTRASAEVLSFRGLDNAAYYALAPEDASAYWESTGCGNNLNASSEPTRRLILDSLTHWLDVMGVDGFRFDLAPVLGREAAARWGFNPRAAILEDIAALAASRDAEVIAEAWDTAGGGYQVGNFPPRWSEWNGRWRDCARKFVKGSLDAGLSPAEALHGDWLHFADQGGPERSVCFITAHDGFTLADLVSYNAKNNGVGWPFGPSDGGSDSNESWDSTWVPAGAGCPDHKAFRRQRMRNLVAFQFLSRGVPMTVYGDEFGRTQNGNNNPWNIDSVATWNNYDMIARAAPQRVGTGFPGLPYHDNLGEGSAPEGRNPVFAFAVYMARLRGGSEALRQAGYEMSMAYSRPDGSPGYEARTDRSFRVRIDGSSVGDRDYLVLVNMDFDEVLFAVEPPDAGTVWKRIVDTAYWAEVECACVWQMEDATLIDREYRAKACSIVILAES